MAPRPYWKGYLRLSLVSCPIALYPATSEREKVSFNQINGATGNCIRYRKVDAETGEEVPSEQIIKGFEVTFLHAPVLAGRRTAEGDDTIALPVTDPPGYQWSWIEKRGDSWIAPSIQAADLFRPFAGPTEIREGWLKLAIRKDNQGEDHGR